MAAKRGAQFLYHASDTEFNPGDIIEPRNYRHAYASSDKSYAEVYGRHLYKVQPVDAEEAKNATAEEATKWGGPMPEGAKSVVYSEKGYRVIKRHGDGLKDPRDSGKDVFTKAEGSKG